MLLFFTFPPSVDCCLSVFRSIFPPEEGRCVLDRLGGSGGPPVTGFGGGVSSRKIASINMSRGSTPHRLAFAVARRVRTLAGDVEDRKQRRRGCRRCSAPRRGDARCDFRSILRRPQTLGCFEGGLAVDPEPSVGVGRRRPSERAVIVYWAAGAVPTATGRRKVRSTDIMHHGRRW